MHEIYQEKKRKKQVNTGCLPGGKHGVAGRQHGRKTCHLLYLRYQNHVNGALIQKLNDFYLFKQAYGVF